MIILENDFEKIRKIDQEFVLKMKAGLKEIRKNLPHYVDFFDYRMTEDGANFFNGRLLGAGMKPRFITKQQEKHVKYRTEIFMKALHEVRDALTKNKKLQKHVLLTKKESKLLEIDHGYSSVVPLARFDGILTKEAGYQVYEMNANCPALSGWYDMAERIISQFKCMKELQKKHKITFYDDLPKKILATVIKNYKEFGKSGKPKILIPRLDGMYNQDSDFLAQEFQKAGFMAIVGNAKQIVYEKGEIFYHGTKYDFVLRWFDFPDYIKEKSIYMDLLKAYEEESVPVMNPFISSVMANKALFSFFNDEELTPYISKKYLDVLKKMCPWTRVVRKRKTTFIDGTSGDLLEMIEKNKNKLLIKPSRGTHGKKIYLGYELSQKEWKEIINIAAKEKCWIVQEKFDIPQIKEPQYNKRKNTISEEIFTGDINAYLVDEKYAAFMGRFSKSGVTNAIRGGAFQIGAVVNN